ncbi:MAG: magnesium transporter, partial [Actinomycetota bacterium]
MAAGSEQLFVSRLARLPVRAPTGETIGRISDVVIARTDSGSPPPVLGFTVMVQRRPIFVGVGRVRELDESGATLSTGTVNLRPFQQREGETLVIGELLDARVRIASTGSEAVVVDAAMEPTRSRDWVISQVAVREL